MKNILIIEDEVEIRNNIQEILELSEFDTLIAENGLQGVQLAKDKHPDLIICDLMMPELDGYSVLTQLRQDFSTATIPLIFLTARADKSD
ncbi:MAG: response regulator transcription factor, partial [Sphaerospermopsis kisseleviana]